MTEEKIYLVPVGNIDKEILENIKIELSGVLPQPAEIEIAPEEKLPESAYNPSRKQYRAGAILEYLLPRIRISLKNERALIIADVDLYEKGLNYVFGKAESNRGVCIISLARLRNEFYGLKPNPELFLKRSIKEAVHELGHTWGIVHCPNPKCVMYFSNSILDTDRKDFIFCSLCQKKLRDSKR